MATQSDLFCMQKHTHTHQPTSKKEKCKSPVKGGGKKKETKKSNMPPRAVCNPIEREREKKEK